MSDRLTDAGRNLLRSWTEPNDEQLAERSAWTRDWLALRLPDIEAEAADRAVDEALSVERMSVEIDRHWLMDTPRGVGCTCQGWSLLLSEVPDEAGLGEHLLPFSAHIAAALAAHLRGPRPEGEG